MKDKRTFDVTIHFPSHSIPLSDITSEKTQHIEDQVTLNGSFRVWNNDNHWFMVKSRMVTFVETKVHKPL